MGSYSKFISEKRRSVPTPNDIFDSEGKPVFGTFNSEFPSMSFMKAKKPTPFPDIMRKLRLTLWEAIEIDLPEGYLLLVICDMGLFGLPFAIYYDYSSDTLHEYGIQTKSKDIITGPNLINGSKTYVKTKDVYGCFTNNLDKDNITLEAKFPGNNEHSKELEVKVDLNRVSLPSVVSIPLGKHNQPLYTQKDLFKCSGYVIVDGKRVDTTDETCAVIDDHRGYYPRRMYYDWCCCMGMRDGKRFGFNITDNQSVNKEDYNENLIWFEGKTSLLPPIKCTHVNNCQTIDFVNSKETPQEWLFTDEHDMVNLSFIPLGVHKNLTNVANVIVNCKYFAAVGRVTGYIRDEDGNKIEFKDYHAIAEDKRMLF